MTVNEKDPQLEAFLDYLRRTRGFEFGAYKRATLGRRIQRRMQDVHLSTFADYQDRLEADPGEFTQLFNTVLINVTDFFRDAGAWEVLRDEVIPRMLEAKGANDTIRAWSVGCSTGQEPYTLAMLLCERLGMSQFTERVKIYGTDVDEDALDTARHATYTTRELRNVPPEMVEKYFEANGNDRRTFKRDLRRSVIFGRHDLLNDAPISRVDILICRNTLMYFNSDVQKRVLARFHFALREQAVLFLGKAESLLTSTSAFTTLSPRHRVFSKTNRPNARDHLLMAQNNGDALQAPIRAQTRAREAAFDAMPQANLVIDSGGLLALANEKARVQFGLTFKDIGRPLQDLQVSYDPVELRQPMSKVSGTRRPEVLRDVAWRTLGGETRWLDVCLLPLDDPDSDKLLGISIQFADMTEHKELQESLSQSNQELEATSEELQSTNEELETTNEELQSTIEELETTNEELQSSNEELETMNEELQSSNEELETLNADLLDRTFEVSQGKVFLESVLEGIEAGIVVVDKDLRVLDWNRKSADLWGLRSEEVRGEYLFNLHFGLPVDTLQEPLRYVLGGLSRSRELMLEAVNRLGKTITIKVVCSPFRNPEGVIIHMEEVGESPDKGRQE